MVRWLTAPGWIAVSLYAWACLRAQEYIRRTPALLGMLGLVLVPGLGCIAGAGETGDEDLAEAALALCVPADCDDGNTCTDDTCTSAGCSHTPKAVKTPCSDDNACTRDDQCDATGACVGLPLGGSEAGGCIIRTCDPDAGPVDTPVPAGTWCTDRNPCTLGDQCDGGGHCLGAPAAAGTGCDDGEACTTSDQCNAAGACVGTALANGTACDGAPCWVEACLNGQCMRTGALDPDGTSCTYASCTTGQTCLGGSCQGGTQLGAGAPCSDGNACNGAEACNSVGACEPGAPLLVGDGQPCTLDICDPGTGAVTHPVADAGAPCSDGDVCNGGETCDGNGPGSSSCLAGSPPAVDDSNPCTLDTCDPVTGVKHAACSPVDRTVATAVYDTTSFLYAGSNSIQKNADPFAFDPKRASVIRGKVSTSAGAPLMGVTIKPVGQPRWGWTTTQANGVFDLAVNGGSAITLSYEKDGYLPARRTVQVPWQAYAWASDVVLIQPDPLQPVSLYAGGAVQGATVTDSSGPRRGALLFASGTTATADGSPLPANVSVRITEYTVGGSGPSAMPAELPPTSGYTYAVEYGLDEAGGASTVQFNQPVHAYVDNFLNLPVGVEVPAGYYDKVKGAWIPSTDGRVISILSFTSGAADVDTDGNGTADNTGMLLAERQQLYALHQGSTLPKTLWRVPVTHFSAWDFNFSMGPPPGAPGPEGDPSGLGDFFGKACKKSGSIVGCHNQVLGESLPLVGTPYGLSYSSDRAPGYKAAYTLKIPRTGAIVPDALQAVDVEVEIAGQKHTAPTLTSPSNSPNDFWSFTWDGKDAYGRVLQGKQPVTVRIIYSYPGEYRAPAASPASSFGGPGDYGLGIGSRDRGRIVRVWRGFLGTFDAAGLKLGGWTVDTHHAYDPIGRTLYLGTGEQHSASGLGSKLLKAAGGGATLGDGGPAIQAKISQPFGIAAAADGSLYIADRSYQLDATGMRIRRIALNGIIETVAGTGQTPVPSCAPDGPAGSVALAYPERIVAGPDGALYFSESTSSHRVRKLLGGTITTVAGGANACSAGYSGDGGPATSARMWGPRGLALSPDGTLYIADSTNDVIRRVTSDGIITTVAGQNGSGDAGDGGPAQDAGLDAVDSLALGPDGSLYLTQEGYHRVRRIRPDGIIEAFAGTGSPGYDASEDGFQAAVVKLNGPRGVAVASDGSVYIADTGNARVRKVSPDGTITTVVGNGTSTIDGAYGGPPTSGSLHSPTGVAVAQDGSLLIGSSSRVKKVTAALPGYTGAGDIAVPSEDGNELYTFDALGRHESTRDAMTGAVLRTFGYTGTLLTSITEVAGNTTTTIQRDGAGQPTGITGPYQQASGITLVPGSSYLWTLTNPNSETFTLTYVGGDGLLDTLTTPRNHTYNFDYDLAGMGRLTSDLDPAGGSLGLSRTDTSTSYSVAVTRAVSGSTSRTTDYELQYTADGRTIRSSTWPDDVVVSTTTDASKVSTTTFDDGTVVTLTKGPDDRFGMSAPIPAAFKVETGGKTFEMKATRSTTWDGSDPMSITGRVDTLQFKEGAAWRTFTSTFQQANGSNLAQYTIETPVGRKRYTRLDAMGRIKEDELQDLGPVVYEYDGNGRLWTVTHKHRTNSSEDRTYELLYDTSGRLETVRDPYNVQIAALVYDGANRPTSLTEPGPVTTGMGYDASGNPTVVTPPGKLSHSLAYSPVDVLTDYTPPGVPGVVDAATTYTHTLDRRLDLAVLPEPNGGPAVTVDVGYDGIGRVQTLTTANDDVPYAVTYGYALATDPEAGKLRTVAGPAGVTITYGYNQSLPVTTDWSGLVASTRRVHREFDDMLRVTGESLRDGTGAILPGGGNIAYGYDNDGALVTAGSLTITRNTTNGLLSSIAIGDITTAVTSYNDFAEPLSVADRRSGTAFFTVNYTGFDKRGRITGRSEVLNTGGGPVTTTWSYEYDDAPGGNGPGRLWKATRNGVTTTYTNDANGNRTGAGWVYDAQDRLTASPGGVSYTYSANGELATRTDAAGTTTYAYDALGNLRLVYRPAPAATIEYIVDGLNRRVGKKVGGVLQQVFLYDEADRIIAELDGAGAVVSRFVYGTRPHVPEYMVKNGTTYRFVTDHLGSVRLVVQVGAGTLTIAQQCEYDPWGQVTCSQGSGFQPFGFAGGLYDPDTGLVRFGARDYDPAVGRWTAKDPIGFGGGDANLYAYVGDDPVNFVDPSGASRLSALRLSQLHTALSIAGMVPWVGEFFDATDAALYLAEGDCLNAGISMAAAIPGWGSVIAGGRLTKQFKPTQTRRHFDFDKVDRYAEMMENRKWDWSMDKIIVDTEGNILSGHHRVLAAEKANVPIPESAIFRVDGVTPRPVYDWADILDP